MLPLMCTLLKGVIWLLIAGYHITKLFIGAVSGRLQSFWAIIGFLFAEFSMNFSEQIWFHLVLQHGIIISHFFSRLIISSFHTFDWISRIPNKRHFFDHVQLICSYNPHHSTILNNSPLTSNKASNVVFEFSDIEIANTVATVSNVKTASFKRCLFVCLII